MGVLGRSAKENERRLPIHPRHFDRIDADLRSRIWLEHGYGAEYGVSDQDLAGLIAGFGSHAELVARTDILLLPKPTLSDVTSLRPGQVLWGWPHCVQDPGLTQAAIDGRVTLIAWEAMNHYRSDGSFAVHVFHRNNELAGYASVLQAMSLRGITGHYGRRRKAVLLGFGNTARGAATALASLGVTDIVALTMRDVQLVADPMPGVTLGGLERSDVPGRTRTLKGTGPVPTEEFLAGFDIIVNCVLQDTDDVPHRRGSRSAGPGNPHRRRLVR
jgi:alanine dehydrogenase